MSYQPSSETVRIHREQVAAWRRACDRRLDRQLAARSDGLGALYRRGLDTVAGIAAEAKRHVVGVERTGDWPGRVQAVCSCGWRGRALASRTAVSDDVGAERDQLRRWGRHSEARAS